MSFDFKDVLLINSYGGSILAAVVDMQLPIRGSYETSGYGIDVQRFNAPNVKFVENTKEWPSQDLSNTLVIGHPPCSAFSTLNSPMRAKMRENSTASIDSKAFECTKQLLDYAMGNGAGMIMIESVPRAMEEARPIHDYYAKLFGYSLIRVIQSSVYFGLPQNRKRFWAVFAKGEGRQFEVSVPRCELTTLSSVIRHDGPAFSDHQRQFDGIMERIKEKYPDETTQAAILRGEYGLGKMKGILTKLSGDPAWAKFANNNLWDVSCLNLLDPNGQAPVVIGSSLWMMDGQLLSLGDYARIMGFPTWYGFPERIATKAGHALGFLSRGVCPPIVRWLVRNFACEGFYADGFFNNDKRDYLVKSGEVMDVVAINKNAGKPPKPPKLHERAARISKNPVNDGVNPNAPKAVVAVTDSSVTEEASV